MDSHAFSIWSAESTESNHTGTWRKALPRYFNPPSPCHQACPVDGNIALWIHQISEKDYRGAWETLIENNPYPSIAGRICHHPCEPVCNRGKYDETIAICGLERFVGDMALEQDWAFPEVPIAHEEKIAIVGGGPAGLAAAFHLRRMGYGVTIFESQPELGGIMRYGIPPYRLSNDVLEKETQRILDLGVEVKTNAPISTRQQYDAFCEEYDAVYLAMGASVPKRLPALDYEQKWVMDGAQYLEQTNTGEVPDLGDRIVVIGGGSAAMDVARTARRHGKEITILCLEPEAQMPAQREEVVEAKEEAIRLVDGAMLQSVSDQGAAGLVLNCIKIQFHPGEVRGQFTLEPIEGSEFTLEADTVVPSIGQDPDLSVLGEVVDTDGALIRIDPQHATSKAGVFAGGDAATMERFVTHAFGMGKQAAQAIHGYLRPDSPPVEKASYDTVDAEVVNKYYYDSAAREHQEHVSVAKRLETFDETQLGLSLQRALQESARCFSCGNCIFCDNCYYYCPDMAIVKLDRAYDVKTDFCKGCGLCVQECPTGSIAMFGDNR